MLLLTVAGGLSVLEAGIAFAPSPAIVALFAGISSRVADRFNPAIVGVPGGIILALACVMLTTLDGGDYFGDYLPTILMAGVGIGVMAPAFTACAVMVIPSERLATGIGGSAVFRKIGAVVGDSAFVAMIG